MDRPRPHDVRTDTTLLQICSPCSDQRSNSSLTRGVNAEGGCTLNTRNRAVENDRAAIPQQGQSLLYGEKRSSHIDVEEFVEMLFCDGPEGNKFANAAVGKNNVAC